MVVVTAMVLVVVVDGGDGVGALVGSRVVNR